MSSKISFILDGKITSIDFSQEKRYTPTTTVLNYLRSLPNHKGTKEGCAEGDCGACTVVLANLVQDKKISYKAVDSCLMFLPMIHGKQVITVENLRSPDNKLHPAQQAMVNMNGSQCGFCTPGIVMSLFALYKNENTYNRTEIEKTLSGNLCRCTGYSPILEAAQTLSKKKGLDHFSQEEKKTIKLLRQIKSDSLSLISERQRYFCPKNVKTALKLRLKHPKSIIISGATDIALRVTKNHEKLKEIIDLSSISSLKGISSHKKYTRIASGTTLSEIRSSIKRTFPAIYDMLDVFGSEQIRNLATIGGNLATASPIGDLGPILIAYNAKVDLVNPEKKRRISVENFITGYRKTALRKNELIEAIIIPHLKSDVRVRFYKFSKREELDISTVSAGYRLELTKKNKVKSIKLVYGGMALMTKRAAKTEKFLMGRDWSLSTVAKASDILSKDFSPISDARASAKGRMVAAKNLLIKFYNDTTH